MKGEQIMTPSPLLFFNLGCEHSYQLLSLKQLTLKSVTIMALVGASRTSELAALNLWFQSAGLEGVTFCLPSLMKKRKVGTPPRKVCFFLAFPHNMLLCVWSNASKNMKVMIFVIIQAVLGFFCLMWSLMGQHSLREEPTGLKWWWQKWESTFLDFQPILSGEASATAAAVQAIPFPNILRTAADWAREASFQQCYYRPNKTRMWINLMLRLFWTLSW